MDEIELIEKRKPREKHFLQKDGTILAKIYDSDIHYLKNGKYEEIDNTLEKRKNIYRNKKNDYRVTFKSNGKNSLVKMAKGKYYIDLKLKYANDSEILKKHTKSKIFKDILYTNIYDGVDIEYQTLSNKIKETLILKNDNYSEFTFVVDTNLDLVQEDDLIVAKNDEMVIFTIDKPFMEDASGMRCTNVNYKLLLVDDKYQIKVILDKNWLSREDIVYPVYVDPTITNESQNITLTDTYIYPGDSNDDRNSKAYLKAGFEKVNGTVRENRSLIKFSLPEIGTGSEIIDAQLELIPFVSNNNNKNARNYLLSVHQVTKDWDEKTAKWEDMHDKYNTKVEALMECNRGYLENINSASPTIISKAISVDLTRLVKSWYKDSTNYGVLIKTVENKFIDDDFPAFFSKDNQVSGANPKPLVYIRYQNQNGLEDYWDYIQQNYSNGSSYINTYNGNMTAVFNIGHTIGGNFPANINLVYNTNDVVLGKSTYFGEGYRLNIEQTIKEIVIDNNKYLEYIDDTGTIHYLYPEFDNSLIYQDEDGLNIKAEKIDNKYILKNNNGSKLTFILIDNKFCLAEVKNVEDAIIKIEYENNKIVRVIDKNESEILFTYNQNNIKLLSPDDEVELQFNNINKIEKIKSKFGFTNFLYNDLGLISNIIDITGLKIVFDYYEESPYKMKKVTQCNLDNEIGQYFTLSYGFNTTNIIDRYNRTTTLIFNDYGNLISKNTLKLDEDISDASSSILSFGTSEIYKNKLVSESMPITYVKNYYKNPSFENDDEVYFKIDNPEYMQTSFSENRAYSGKRSLRIDLGHAGQTIEQDIVVPKGRYYTYSGYFINSDKITIALCYKDKNGKFKMVEKDIEPSNEFQRNDITIFYEEDATTNLQLRISSGSICLIYLDDVQVEEGKVANVFNIIENSDFSEGIEDWNLHAVSTDGNIDNTNNHFEVVNINDNKNKALKVAMKPMYKTSFRKRFLIKGKKDDLYTVSFWYKNEGVPVSNQDAENKVKINFYDLNGQIQNRISTSKEFDVNDNVWQFYSYRASALEDFNEVELIFEQNRQANNFYVTNISLYKNITSGDYNYNDEGKLITTKDQSNNESQLKYNNGLLEKIIDPIGRNFKYEYDNKNRLINILSSTGISHKSNYDLNGNLVSSKICKNVIYDLKDEIYKIRNKGTDKYLKSKLNSIVLESNSCSNSNWKLQKISDDTYNIYDAVLPQYMMSYSGNNILLSFNKYNNLFKIEKNKNGSFYISVNTGSEVKYFKGMDDKIKLEKLDEKDQSFEFIFENDNNQFLESNITYTSDGRFVESITDSSLIKYSYDVDPITGLNTSITDGEGNIKNFEYDNKENLISLSSGDREISYSYNELNLLDKISQNNNICEFKYNKFLDVSEVKIGNNTFVKNNYDNSGKLLSIDYGNNQSISLDYDEFDRANKLNKMDNTYLYSYDNNGNIAKIDSNNSNECYYYDVSNRLYKYQNGDFILNNTYDSSNNVIAQKYKLYGYASSEKYEDIENLHLAENKISNDLIYKNVFDEDEINYEYDSLERIINKNINNKFDTKFSYISQGNKTTSLIESFESGNDKYSFKYDKVGNITDVYLNNHLIKKFQYNQYNELVREEDLYLNKYIDYVYDNSGNMLSKTEKSLGTDEIEKKIIFKYENPNWSDQLTSYNGITINYDKIGNPIKIGENISLDWINGRTLDAYSDISKNLNIKYKYNSNGIRTSKKVNGIETKYFLENNNIIFETRNRDVIYYFYDLTGVCGFKYNKDVYYYEKNLQNDIIGILNSDYEKIVSYKYDSWGNIESIKDQYGEQIVDPTHIGLINPFRYRSYYYDNETELYYLNSRYYNPKFCRFLNADGIISTNEEIDGCNVYIYSYNNPIMYVDIDGNSSVLALLFGTAAAKIFALAVAAVVIPKAPAAITSIVGAVTNTVANVSIGISSKKSSSKTCKQDNNEKLHNVYILVDQSTNKIEYVGRTTKIDVTRRRHKANPFRADLKLKEVASNIDKPTARGLEQFLIIACHSLERNKEYPRKNQINGLSQRRNYYNYYMDKAQQWATENDRLIPCH